MVPSGAARQPSLFGVEASDPTPADLAGLLAGPGTSQQMGGTARVSVPVTGGWRVHALIAELALRSLPASWEPAGELAGQPAGEPDTFVVRTAYTTRLWGLAQRWQDGPPPGLHLGGQALRLWVAAAGAPEPDGYLLGVGPASEASWSAVGAALHAAGLAAALVVPAAGATAGRAAGATAGRAAEAAAGRAAGYRVTGRRRLARLAELVGDPPAVAPPGHWPVNHEL